MEINLEHYKLFYNVAKCGSFSKAAEQLYISQPAITQSIKKLEEGLGGTLFYRNTKGIILTEEGKNLYNFIEESIETLNNAQERFQQYKNLEKGKIIIKGSDTVIEQLLEKPLSKFVNDYPNIKIEILKGGHTDTLKDLSEGKIDMAILNLPVSYKYKNIQIIEICKSEFIFIMSKKYQEKNKVKINNIDDLTKYELIAPRKGTKYRELLDSLYNTEKHYKYEIMSESLQKKLAKENIGIAFITKDKVKEELENGEFIEIKIKDKMAELPIGIGTLKNEAMNFATKKLIEYIKNEVKTC